jgi:hypothetical protein
MALTALTVGFSGTPVQAQRITPPVNRPFGFTPLRNLGFTGGPVGFAGQPINPNWLVAPGVSLNQATYNLAVAGQAYSSIPPYLLGYNPYALTTGYGLNPYSVGYPSSPYANLYGSAYANPYASLYANPVGGYGGYGTGGYGTGSPGSYTSSYDPYGGYLRGSANVIDSQGKLVLQLEQARQTHEKTRQARIDTRRKLFEELTYERAHTLSFTERREQAIAESLRRSQGSAPVTEVWSAKALNDLLADLKKLHGHQVRGPRIELDPETLKQINVRGNRSGSIGLLRDAGRLHWPLGLRDLEPAGHGNDLRRTLEAKAIEAVNQASSGRVNPGVIKDLQANVSKLHGLLARNVNELSANQYIEAKRFLNQFDDAIRALRDPNVGNYFNHTYVAQGKTVEELVKHMTQKGLTFAPATAGDEAAYQALHSALAAYDLAAYEGEVTAKE